MRKHICIPYLYTWHLYFCFWWWGFSSKQFCCADTALRLAPLVCIIGVSPPGSMQLKSIIDYCSDAIFLICKCLLAFTQNTMTYVHEPTSTLAMTDGKTDQLGKRRMTYRQDGKTEERHVALGISLKRKQIITFIYQ